MLLLLLIPLLAVAGYFLPAAFHLSLALGETGVSLRLELEVMHGLVRKTFMPGQGPGRHGTGGVPGRKPPRPAGVEAACQAVGFGQRLQLYGFGGTMLSFFLPTEYLPWLRVASRLERKGRFTRVHWRTSIGLDEAALTAWAVGLLWTAKTGLLSLLDRRYGFPRSGIALAVTPSFGKPGFGTSLDCIFTLRVGQIIYASLCAYARYKMRGRAPVDDERAPD